MASLFFFFFCLLQPTSQLSTVPSPRLQSGVDVACLRFTRLGSVEWPVRPTQSPPAVAVARRTYHAVFLCGNRCSRESGAADPARPFFPLPFSPVHSFTGHATRSASTSTSTLTSHNIRPFDLDHPLSCFHTRRIRDPRDVSPCQSQPAQVKLAPRLSSQDAARLSSVVTMSAPAVCVFPLPPCKAVHILHQSSIDMTGANTIGLQKMIRRKKNVKKGIQFCLMVCGASGTGTSSPYVP